MNNVTAGLATYPQVLRAVATDLEHTDSAADCVEKMGAVITWLATQWLTDIKATGADVDFSIKALLTNLFANFKAADLGNLLGFKFVDHTPEEAPAYPGKNAKRKAKRQGTRIPVEGGDTP